MKVLVCLMAVVSVIIVGAVVVLNIVDHGVIDGLINTSKYIVFAGGSVALSAIAIS